MNFIIKRIIFTKHRNYVKNSRRLHEEGYDNSTKQIQNVVDIAFLVLLRLSYWKLSEDKLLQHRVYESMS